MTDALLAADSLRMRVGLDLGLPRGVSHALTEVAKTDKRDIVFVRHYDGSHFHPKVYVAKFDDEIVGVVGSSNASAAAFGMNIEANVVISGTRFGPEESLLDSIANGIMESIQDRARDQRLITWKLPTETPPPFTPSALHRPLVDEPTDHWQRHHGFLTATLIADFSAPLSGVAGYVARTGHQGGFDIENSQIDAVERLIPQGQGAQLQLAWRFVTRSGRTIFAVDEPPRRVVQSGYSGNNRVITTPMRVVAEPLMEILTPLRVTEGRVHVMYKLERREGEVPRLWMMHTLPIADSPANTSMEA